MSRRSKSRLYLSLFTLTGLIMFVPVGLIVLHPITGTIAYATAWDTDGVAFDEDGGWTVVSDLGYTVHVTGGSLLTHSATMTPCDHGTGLVDWLSSLFQPHIVHAGHETLGLDPASLKAPTEESLTALAPSELGTVTVSEFSYCQGHTVSAAVPSDETDGISLRIEGTYIAPGSDAVTAFSIQTGQAYGKLFDLTGASGEATHAVVGRPLRIVITRRLATMFDGVDFLQSPDAAYDALKSLMRDTRMIVSEDSAS